MDSIFSSWSVISNLNMVHFTNRKWVFCSNNHFFCQSFKTLSNSNQLNYDVFVRTLKRVHMRHLAKNALLVNQLESKALMTWKKWLGKSVIVIHLTWMRQISLTLSIELFSTFWNGLQIWLAYGRKERMYANATLSLRAREFNPISGKQNG